MWRRTDMSGVSWPTIQRMETATGVPSSLGTNLEIVQRTLENAGISFIDENGGGPGGRLRRGAEKGRGDR